MATYGITAFFRVPNRRDPASLFDMFRVKSTASIRVGQFHDHHAHPPFPQPPALPTAFTPKGNSLRPFTHVGKCAAMISMVLALTCGAYGQAEPKVPFDLEKFQPVLSECRLHSPRTSGNIAVKRGQFGGYELPARFYLGEDGATMVLATTNRGRDRSELRHNTSWSLLGEEKRFSARLRFDKPVALEGKSRLHLMQVYGTGKAKGPTVLVSWAGSAEAGGSEDLLVAYVKGSKTHDLGARPDGFFNLDVSIKEGKVRIFIDNELKVEDDILKFAVADFFYKTGTYHKGIEPQAVVFESLSITAK